MNKTMVISVFKNFYCLWLFLLNKIFTIVPVKLPMAKNGDPAADPHVDLRAELQRRRGHRYEVIIESNDALWMYFLTLSIYRKMRNRGVERPKHGGFWY